MSKRNLWIIVGVIGFIIIVSFFPTPHPRIRTEFKSDRLKTLDCSTTLSDGYYIDWDLTDIPSDIRIDVSLDSLEEVVVYINTVQGVITNREQKIHHYSLNGHGPILYVKVQNPTFFGYDPSTVVSGEIKVFHDYETQVPYDEWLPWWIP